ncbi:MAG: LysR substrate-binding domain-containing protein [Pseudomonadota bacterium]
MELKQLRCFVAVANSGSITGGARVLGLRQPTVSNHIRRLEDRFSTNLFERSVRGMTLTFAGRQFLRTARRIVEDLDLAFARADRVAEAKLGALTLGFYTSLSGGPLRETLKLFRSESPDVTVELHEGSPPDLLELLREQRIDLAVTVLDVSNEEFDTQKIWDEELVVAFANEHPLGVREALSWKDLEEVPLVVRTWESGSVLYNFLSARIAPDNYVHAEQHYVSREALLGLIGIGFGMTVMGASAAAASFPGVVFRSLTGPHATVSVNAVWLKGNDNPARGRFVSLIRDWRLRR